MLELKNLDNNETYNHSLQLKFFKSNSFDLDLFNITLTENILLIEKQICTMELHSFFQCAFLEFP